MPVRTKHQSFPLGAVNAGAASAEFDLEPFTQAILGLTAGAALAVVVQCTNRPLAHAILADDIAAGATTINLMGQYAQNFPSGGGNITINGDAIAYTGRTGAQLTGVTGVQAGGHKRGSAVLLTTGSDDRVWHALQTQSPAGAGSFAYPITLVPRHIRVQNIGAGNITAGFIEGIRQDY